MTRTIKAFCASLLIAGCANSSVTGGGTFRQDGLGSDLRVFMDNACLPEATDSAESLGPFGFGATTLGEIAVGAGEIAFQSFGRYLEEAGQPDIDTSTALTSDLFYSGNPSDDGFGDLASAIRCVHIVRHGFEPGPALQSGEAPYAHLGLLSQPSLYALVRLDPADDRSAFFRGQLMHMEVDRFERVGGEFTRDIALSLGFNDPAYGSDQHFALGVIQLPGIELKRTFGEAETRGIVTAWMSTPPRTESSERFPFNLYVDVAESKRGNPFLADIGRLLQSQPVVESVSRDIAEVVVGDRTRRREEADIQFTLLRRERRLSRDLEDATRDLQGMLDENVDDADTLTFAIRQIEDAIDAVDQQRAAEGWTSEGIEPLISEASSVISEARANL